MVCILDEAQENRGITENKLKYSEAKNPARRGWHFKMPFRHLHSVVRLECLSDWYLSVPFILFQPRTAVYSQLHNWRKCIIRVDVNEWVQKFTTIFLKQESHPLLAQQKRSQISSKLSFLPGSHVVWGAPIHTGTWLENYLMKLQVTAMKMSITELTQHHLADGCVPGRHKLAPYPL